MSEKRRERSGGRICCVPGCANNQSNSWDVKFYSFPNRDYETERKKLWIARVRRQGITERPWLPTKTTTICSVHFVGGEKSNDPRKENYNPTIFPWNPEEAATIDRRTRFEKRNGKKSGQSTSTQNDAEEEEEKEAEDNFEEQLDIVMTETAKCCEISVQTDDITTVDDLSDETTLFCWQNSVTNEASTQTYIRRTSNIKTKVRVIEIEAQKTKCTSTVAVGPDLNMRNGFQWFMDIKDDTSMKQLGGITLSFFYLLLGFIKPNSEGQPKFYKVMNSEDRLLLFLMKMKLGLHFSALSCIFKISKETARSIFFQVLECLYEATKTWIFWPSKEAVKGTLPATFRHYPNCRAIIDCTELRCETPPTVEQRAQMYSSYKSCFTVKYLIAMTPNGFISFLSKGYGGRTSDCIIVNDSGFLNLIQPGDEIMADKGFPKIRTELLQHNSILIMPPFAINPQFTREEVLQGYSIASVRIHIERCIQRIRIFQVLDHVTIRLLPFIDKIMYVSGVLANNKEPIIKDA